MGIACSVNYIIIHYDYVVAYTIFTALFKRLASYKVVSHRPIVFEYFNLQEVLTSMNFDIHSV